MTLQVRDVDLVIHESNCTLNQSINTLVEEENDIISSIMALTM